MRGKVAHCSHTSHPSPWKLPTLVTRPPSSPPPCSFFMLAFGVLGVELFAGRLRYRCFELPLTEDSEAGGVCTCPNMTSLADLNEGLASCNDMCASGEQCIFGENPSDGATSFDNVFNALLTIFQAVSLEGWSEMMHMLGKPQPFWAYVYFVVLVFFGAMFILNLYVVVMSESYLMTRANLDVTPEKERRRQLMAAKRKILTTGEAWYSRLRTRLVSFTGRCLQGVERRLPGSQRVRKHVDAKWFTWVMVLTILANVCVESGSNSQSQSP